MFGSLLKQKYLLCEILYVLQVNKAGCSPQTPATGNSILDQFEVHANIYLYHCIEGEVGSQKSFHQHNQLKLILFFFVISKEMLLNNHKIDQNCLLQSDQFYNLPSDENNRDWKSNINIYSFCGWKLHFKLKPCILL